jgi:DNA helicase IV
MTKALGHSVDSPSNSDSGCAAFRYERSLYVRLEEFMPHPDLPLEQDYVDHAYECLAVKRERREELVGAQVAAHPRQAKQVRDALREAANAVDVDGPLVFGRIDDVNGDSYYVGRTSVLDDAAAEPVVISWKSAAAQPFFQAAPDSPMGLTLRRRMVAEGRRLLDLYDEWFDELSREYVAGRLDLPDPPVLGADALLLDLERRRTGEMRDIVATIQAEQDRAIRGPVDGVLIVQGGPGTGKSAVGLHRAAVLLFQHEELRRDGVLVVGPNEAFMRYIAKVLPSLGEADVQQHSITKLGVVVPVRAEDAPKAQRVKGDGRMATVLRRALFDRVRPAAQELKLPGAAVVISEERVAELLSECQHGRTYDEARRAFSDAFARVVRDDFVEAVRERSGVSPLGDSLQLIQRHDETERALDRLFPRVTSREILRDLLSSRARISAAADGELDPEEQALLLRSRVASMQDEPWTTWDLPLLDELEALIHGERVTYAHVVVDEAQDLSPMQLRMLARRCPRQSFTLLGDLAQSTGFWADREWHELVAQLAPDAPVRVTELTIGYRVPAELMNFAARLLPFTAPDLAVPRSVRPWAEPEVTSTEEHRLPFEAVRRATQFAAEGRSAAIVAAGPWIDAVRDALESTKADYGDARAEELGKAITLLPAPLAKGLEFEAVVVVEPSAFKDLGDDGLRLLYVALTRSTQELAVLHASRLPAELQSLSLARDPVPSPAVTAPEEAEPASPTATADAALDIEALLPSLSMADQRLLVAVAEWLAANRQQP